MSECRNGRTYPETNRSLKTGKHNSEGESTPKLTFLQKDIDLNLISGSIIKLFIGHTMGGFGGSNKNIGIGCADGRIGKGMIHTVEGSSNMWSIAEEELMERITESSKATVDHFGKQIAYINCLRNMSVSCDCEGVGAEPVVTPNIGILASTDILAIDQASVDLVFALGEDDLSKKITQIADDTKTDPSDFLASQFFCIYIEEPFTD
ncbi:DUF362 domain-containing protein [Blautia obeum]|nr:DUF362 domain-containing protein [Blautia obeum]